ncbi:MAG: putative toxin-antitoxin system toxin component, PIN family [Planctomycetes bacterium]|nr:putative toxin-antitoxin system toxin component, PIN family [Planctomycetota bacterium]MBM4080438.1 putative toxin-antitoxin system toxin component, PIN family [Planctomycetota bacterium]MBM4085455.1 putative toxin-antitoxin system toxin component, PIN family [Planctomycetota bacterium]
MPDRVVFDTNVSISGLLWRGKPHRSLLMARAGIVRSVYCQPMRAELSEKLRTVFNFSEEHAEAARRNLERMGDRVEISGELRVVKKDPDDDKFVECAMVGGASLIVSGDHHLLEIREYEGIRIVTPAEFVAWFSERP